MTRRHDNNLNKVQYIRLHFWRVFTAIVVLVPFYSVLNIIGEVPSRFGKGLSFIVLLGAKYKTKTLICLYEVSYFCFSPVLMIKGEFPLCDRHYSEAWAIFTSAKAIYWKFQFDDSLIAPSMRRKLFPPL